jgi:small conductance mechanosensitive channel
MNLDLGQFNQVVAAGWIPAQAVLFLLGSFIGARLVLNWTTRAMRRAHIELGTQILIKRALVVSWILVTVLWVLGILGVNPAGLVAVAGTFAVAFSLAIQDILKNVFTGVYLLLERPFRVGDTIRVKDQTGVVENIGLRTTQLRTNDNVQVMVPNATVFGEVVANQTYQRPASPAEVAADGHSEADQAKTRA